MPVAARYARQARLAEVGEAGQRALTDARVELGLGGAAGELASRYLRGAGCVVERTDVGAEDAPHAAWIDELDPSARDLARGAYAALVVVRDLLGMSR